MMSKMALVGLAAAAVLVTGCLGKTDDTAAAKTELEGTWVNACKADGDNSYAKQTMVFSGNALTATYTLYSDAACATEAAVITTSLTVALGAAVTTPADSKKIDMTYGTSVFKPKTAAAVTSFNTASLCGASDWKLDTEKDVSGKTCGGGDPVPAVGAVEYTVYKLSGTSLQFGKATAAANGKTDATRETDIDTTAYTKQ